MRRVTPPKWSSTVTVSRTQHNNCNGSVSKRCWHLHSSQCPTTDLALTAIRRCPLVSSDPGPGAAALLYLERRPMPSHQLTAVPRSHGEFRRHTQVKSGWSKNSTAIEVCKRDWRVPRPDCRSESHGGLQIHTNKSASDVPQPVGLVVVLVAVSNVVWCSGVVPPVRKQN